MLNRCKHLVILFFLPTIAALAQPEPDLDTLFRAVTDGRAELVRSLVQEHPDWVDRELYLGIRPLYRASVLGRSEIAQILIDSGADIQGGTERGTLPLHAASQNGHLAIVEMLLAARAQPDAVDESGATALLLAARHKQNKVMTELLRNGANPNIRDNDGRTPLHFSAGLGQYEAVQILVEGGAELSPVDDAGYSPLGWARTLKRNGFGDVGGWLEARGGEDIRPPEPEENK